MAEHDGRVPAGPKTTMHTGPLGSRVHILHADAGTVTALAAIDWNRWFGRVCLDPVRGLVVLMTPSHLHEDLAEIFDDIVDAAASVSKRLGSTRLRGRDEPSGTGMEPDCAFYLDERARGYRAALVDGEAAVESVRRTHSGSTSWSRSRSRTPTRAGSSATATSVSASSGGCTAATGTHDLRADFFGLHPGRPPRRLAASAVLAGLTPGDVCEAADSVRLCLTRDERTEAVARIVRRRRRASVRVREAETPYAAPPG